MIRTVLASPWLPLLYWLAAVLAVICGARRESLKRHFGPHEFQMVGSTLVPTVARSREDSSILQPPPAKQAMPIVCQSNRFWYLQIFVLRKPDTSVQGQRAGIATNKTLISPGPKTQTSGPITMLSIRVDPPEQSLAKTLAIQCRTSLAIDSAHGRTVTIHGVVTQEVVSSVGKILIMAGSRVVGSARLDPENGRFKSDGLWSVFFDNTELKVQAELLDRPSGMPGMLGRAMSNENEALQMDPVIRDDDRSILVPRNTPFVLELHGEILLRDLNSNEASN
jgi:hypothetical protein